VVSSMTGYGRAEVSKHGLNVSVEIRSVNSRYLDITTRSPRTLSHREREIKDLVKNTLSRGSVNITIKLDREDNGIAPLRVNKEAAKQYYRLLNEVRRTVKLKESVKLSHLLSFSDLFESVDEEDSDEKEWKMIVQTINEALASLNDMRAKEGGELAKDLRARVDSINTALDLVEKNSKERMPEERKRLNERVEELISDKKIIDQNRLELELVLLADRLDVTEECVRFRTHNKFFREALSKKEASGRKLNFLIQEMNREANTIGSKTNDAEIAHVVVTVKEELEKIREQLQNIE
jgi:uncharacterized protein (TIGR00255 family)